MASSKVMMASSKPRNSDLSSSSSRSRRASASSSSPRPSAAKPTSRPLSHSQPPSDPVRSNDVHDFTPSTPSPPTMTVDGILRNVYATHPSSESTLLDAQITLIDTPAAPPPPSIETSSNGGNNNNDSSGQDMGSVSVFPQSSGKTVEEVWREIVAGRKEMKDEPDEMMTLEDFLAKAGAVDVGRGGGGEEEEEEEVKIPQPERPSGGVYAFDPVPQSAFQVLDNVEGSIIGFGNEVDVQAGGGAVGSGGRGKRGRAPALEPLDKAAQQRQRRMIKNRESAARSRERKQAYQVELESLAVRLEEENEQLLKEKEERTRERFKQLMEKVVPVVEKQKPPRVLRKIHSWRW